MKKCAFRDNLDKDCREVTGEKIFEENICRETSGEKNEGNICREAS